MNSPIASRCDQRITGSQVQIPHHLTCVTWPVGLPDSQAQASSFEDVLNLRALEHGFGSALQPGRDVAVVGASFKVVHVISSPTIKARSDLLSHPGKHQKPHRCLITQHAVGFRQFTGV